MKRTYILKIVVMATAILCVHFNSIAQEAKKSKIIGCWKFARIEFLEPTNDSMDIINGTRNSIVCFDEKGKFITKEKIGNTENMVGEGNYKISPDGKTISQNREGADDGGIDDSGEIIKLSDTEFIMKIETVIVHMERISK